MISRKDDDTRGGVKEHCRHIDMGLPHGIRAYLGDVDVESRDQTTAIVVYEAMSFHRSLN